MKKHVFGLTLAALLLTACGGSNDDNSNNPADPGQKAPGGSEAPIAPGKDETPSDPGKKNPGGDSQLIPPPANQGNPDKKEDGKGSTSKYQGSAFIVPLGKQPQGIAEAKSISSETLTELNLDGKKLPLQLPTLKNDNLNVVRDATIGSISYRQFAVSGSRYANSKFGYLTLGDQDYIFSQGTPTATMPTSGVVKYSGAAAIGQAGVVDSAIANFNADFGTHALTGSITQNANSNIPFKPIVIAAGIEGNRFKSKDGAAVQTTGGFYGDNARELGGIFQDSAQTLSGSFGAVRTN